MFKIYVDITNPRIRVTGIVFKTISQSHDLENFREKVIFSGMIIMPMDKDIFSDMSCYDYNT